MTRVKHFVLIWLLALHFIPCEVNAKIDQSVQEDFFEANRAYKNDRFQVAVDGYLKLVENGIENGHLYYNLGNAYYRLGDLGKAILFFERARLLLPRDDDLIFNLSHARNQTVDAIADVQTFSLSDFLGLDSLNLYEVFLVFTIINGFFFFIFGIRLYKKTEWSFYLSIFLSIFIGIFVSTLAIEFVRRVGSETGMRRQQRKKTANPQPDQKYESLYIKT